MHNVAEPSDRSFSNLGALHAAFARMSLFNLAGIALIIAAIGLALANLLTVFIPPASTPQASQYAAPFRVVTIGGVELIIPGEWIEPSARTGGSFSDQTILHLSVPFFENTEIHKVDVVLMPLSAVQTSAYLLDKVYLHQFQQGQLSGPVGLIGKPLEAREGYQNEIIWYDPLSPSPYVAKCLGLDATQQTASCMRTVRGKGSLAITYQFDQSLLADWRNFDANIAPFLTNIGAL